MHLNPESLSPYHEFLFVRIGFNNPVIEVLGHLPIILIHRAPFARMLFLQTCHKEAFIFFKKLYQMQECKSTSVRRNFIATTKAHALGLQYF